MFLRHRPRHFHPPASKIFIAFQLINVENRRHIMNYQFNLAAICLVYGWLNSGALALAIRHHLLKVGIFMEHRFYSQKVKKIKIKSRPPASFSKKKVPEKHIIKFLWP